MAEMKDFKTYDLEAFRKFGAAELKVITSKNCGRLCYIGEGSGTEFKS